MRLGFRKELDAAPEGTDGEALYQRQVDAHYAQCGAINLAMRLEVDAVIDPAETRRGLAHGLAGARIGAPRAGGLDPW